MVAEALVDRWELAAAKDEVRGRSPRGAQGRDAAPAARASRCCCPQTYMNDAGRSVGPARGSYKLDLDRVLVVHDEIDLPFGEVRARTGGGLAGHNGLKSLKRELGSADFTRVRVGVGRPDSDRPGDRLRLRARALPRGRAGGRRAGRARRASEVERIVLGEARARLSTQPRLVRGLLCERHARCRSARSSPISTTTRPPQRSRARAAARSSRQSLRPFVVAALADQRRRAARRWSSSATTARRATSPPTCAPGWRRARCATTRAAASPTSRT